ncbi:helix-turn-helix domain-containing protein [Streptosporangium sp. V21-05]|uniref:helix-turn-helix domain-containing protein n=1 Tax=Streptosporangium sp. V21-05 TaxID=3446115 RepID=UPI003F53C4C1
MDSETFGQTLRRLRGDLSIRDVANRAKCGKSYVSALEHDRRTPSPAVIIALDEALGARGELIAAACKPSRPSVLERAEELRRGMTDVLASGGMSDAGIEDWERVVARYGRATRYRPEADLLADLLSDFSDLLQVLEHRHPAAVRRKLSVVAAHLSGLVALTLLKLGDDRSRDWWRTGRAAAAAAEDRAAQSWMYAQESYALYYDGDMIGAIELAQRAQSVAEGEPYVGAALAAPLEARAHAALRRGDAADHALRRAEEALERLDPELATASAFGYSESQLRFHAGNTWTHLRQSGRAWQEQQRALELYSEEEHTDRTLIHLDWALCLAHDGDTAAAAAHATTALVALPHEHRSHLIIERARHLTNSVPASRLKLSEVRALKEVLALPADRDVED